MLETPSPVEETPSRPTPAERIRTVALVLIAICAVGASLYFLRGILTPLLIALFLFFLIKPAADAISRRRLPAWLTYTLLLAAGLVVVYGTGRVVEVNVEAFQKKVPEYRGRLMRLAEAVSRWIGRPEEEGPTELGQLFDISQQEIARQAVGTAVGFVEVTVMVLFYLLFLFLEAQELPKRVRAAYAPALADKILQIGNNVRDGINRYLAVKTAVSLGLAATTGLLGYLFGLDFWPLWAVLMFVSNYVTYVGSIAALLPPIGMAFLQFSPILAAIFAALLVALRFLWIDYVEIRFSGKRLNISPLLLLLSLAVFGWLWGVVGMVLAVPLVTVTKIILLNFETTRHWGKLISEK
jgi:predicted PurR-regulated permease PerM